MITGHSPMARLGVQVASPLAIVIGVYLLFAGHNNPGGGFAAGLVFGAVISLRTVTGLQRPRNANEFIAVGIAIVAAVALAPLVVGDPILNQGIIEAKVPLLGKVKSGSALPFDIGVTAIVVGLMLAVLDGLGASDLGDENEVKLGEERP